MLNLFPVASSLHPAAAVQSTLDRLTELIRSHGIEINVGGTEEGKVPDPAACLVLTGGSEHQALEWAERISGPVVLIAHPDQNSFPAALEILSRLRQLKRQGTIVLLGSEQEGFQKLKRMSAVLQARIRLRGTKIGRIGQPSPWLVGSSQEPATASAAWGVTIVDIPLDEVTREIPLFSDSEVHAAVQDLASGASAVLEPSSEDLGNSARIYLAVRRVSERHGLNALTLRCFDLVTDLRTTGCYALSRLTDEGIIAGCEGDLPALLTMVLLSALTGEVPFMANPQDLSTRDGTLWLAHCTIGRKLLRSYKLRSHFESSLGVGIEGDLEPGPVTLARIGGEGLREIFVDDGKIVETGSSALRCRTQVKVRLGDRTHLEYFCTRPLGNHHVLVRGHWAEGIKALF